MFARDQVETVTFQPMDGDAEYVTRIHRDEPIGAAKVEAFSPKRLVERIKKLQANENEIKADIEAVQARADAEISRLGEELADTQSEREYGQRMMADWLECNGVFEGYDK